MSQESLEKLLALEEGITRAGEALLHYWPGRPESKGIEVTIKGDGSPVTKADLASNEILVSTIRQLWPEDEILSEEIPPREQWSMAERVWIIDPLDGTRSFTDGNDDFSILVGLSKNGTAELGYMYLPVQNRFAKGSKGQGTYINGIRAAVSTSSELRPSSLYFRNFTPAPGPHLFEQWMDSGCAFLALCSGEFDGVIIKMTSHREWDIAAPMVLVEESGGRVTDESGRPIRFDSTEFGCKFVVASNGRVHERLLEIVRASE